MIVKVQFEDDPGLAMLFGDNIHKKWHKYFREFVHRFRHQLPTISKEVEICEQKWPFSQRAFKWIPIFEFQRILDEVYNGKGQPYCSVKDFTFYKNIMVKDKVDHILFTNVVPNV